MFDCIFSFCKLCSSFENMSRRRSESKRRMRKPFKVITQEGKDLEKHLGEVIEHDLALFGKMSLKDFEEKIHQIAQFHKQAMAKNTKESFNKFKMIKSFETSPPPSPLSRTRLIENPAKLPPNYALSKAIAELDNFDMSTIIEKTKSMIPRPVTLSPKLFSKVLPPKSLPKDSSTSSSTSQKKDNYIEEDEPVDFIDHDD